MEKSVFRIFFSIIIVWFLFMSFAHGQCLSGIPLQYSHNSEDVPELCSDVDTTHCFRMQPDSVAGTDNLDGLCPGQANVGPNNMHYFSFIASGNQLSFELNVYDCINPIPEPEQTGNGIQWGIFSKNPPEFVFCDAYFPNVGNFTFENLSVTPGVKYFFFIDGWQGSECTVEFDFIEGFEIYEVNESMDLDTDFDINLYDPPLNESEVCLGGEIEFNVETADSNNGVQFHWNIDPPTIDYPDGIVDSSGNSSVNIVFSEINSYEICSYGFTSCDTSNTVCTTVQVSQVSDVVLDDYYACIEDFPIIPSGWFGPALPSSGEYTYLVEDPIYSCAFSQTITVFSKPGSEEGNVEDVICIDGNFISYEICENVISPVINTNTPVEGIVYCDNYNMYNCDSVVNYSLYFISVLNTLLTPNCNVDQLEFYWIGTVPTPTTDRSILYNLYYNNELLQEINADTFDIYEEPFIANKEDGVYQLEIIVEQNNINCTFLSPIKEVNIEELVPETPITYQWNQNPCYLDIVDYSIDNISNQDLVYNWSLKYSGEIEVLEEESNQISIDWSEKDPNESYQLCVSSFNGCAMSQENCQEIELIEKIEANWTGPDTICVFDIAEVEYSGIEYNNANYNWDFDDGNIDTTETNFPGPFELTFDTSGEKIISLSVDYGSCLGDVYKDTIDVEELLTPDVQCFSFPDSIAFTWEKVADEYIVNIIEQPTNAEVTQGENFIYFTNLLLDDFVEIEVTAIGSGVCPDAQVTSSCAASLCPPIIMSLSNKFNSCVDVPDKIYLEQELNDVSLEWEIFPSTGFDASVQGDSLLVEWSEPANYKICLYGSNICGISDTACVNTIIQPLDFVLDTIILCDQEEIEYQGVTINDSGEYKIEKDDYCFDAYYLQVISSDQLVNAFKDNLKVDLSTKPFSVNILENDILPDVYEVSIVEVSSDNFIQESFEDGVISFDLNNHFIDTITVTYEICTSNCPTCSEGKLFITDELYEDLIFTNIITPNGDGVNDVLQFLDEDLQESSLKIFNQYGNVIMETENYKNDWSPVDLPDGQYYYILKIGDEIRKNSLIILK